MATGSVTSRSELLERAAKQIAASPHARAAQAFFATSGGRELLEILEKTFIYGDLQGPSELHTAFNLGAREVVLYLRRLAHLRERTGTDETTNP